MTQTSVSDAKAADARTYTIMAQDNSGHGFGEIEIPLGRHPWTYVDYLNGTFTPYPDCLIMLCDALNFKLQLRTAARELVFRDAVGLRNDSTGRRYNAPKWVVNLGVIWKPNDHQDLLFYGRTRNGGERDEAIVFQHADADCDLWLGDGFENLPDAIAKLCTEHYLTFGAHRSANPRLNRYVIASDPKLVRRVIWALKKADEPLLMSDFTTETHSSLFA